MGGYRLPFSWHNKRKQGLLNILKNLIGYSKARLDSTNIMLESRNLTIEGSDLDNLAIVGFNHGPTHILTKRWTYTYITNKKS